SFLSFLHYHTSTTETISLSLHDALPIFEGLRIFQPAFFVGQSPILSNGQISDNALLANVEAYGVAFSGGVRVATVAAHNDGEEEDRKSTRLNSSHLVISYAVFCLKKKNF